MHRTVNLGLVRSVADDGMLVPVVHAAAGLTLRALARRITELDERVASRQLTTDDLMGGTFTLLGAPSDHTLWSEAIIIQPQVAVISVGAVRRCPSSRLLTASRHSTSGVDSYSGSRSTTESVNRSERSITSNEWVSSSPDSTSKASARCCAVATSVESLSRRPTTFNARYCNRVTITSWSSNIRRRTREESGPRRSTSWCRRRRSTPS